MALREICNDFSRFCCEYRIMDVLRCLAVLPGIWLLSAVAIADELPTTFVRDGLILNWEVSSKTLEAGKLLDDTGSANAGQLRGNAKLEDGPLRLELAADGAAYGDRPLRPERITVEALFRVDRTGGPLQLIVTTHSPDVRKPGKIEPGNSRQWFLQLRGEPPQQDGYLGFLEFGIFGEDQSWHSLMSEARVTKGWHHALGAFDGKHVRLFLDGRQQTRTRSGRSCTYEGVINNPPDSVINLPAVGTNSHKRPNGLSGAVALARLYDRALSDAEIEQNVRYARSVMPPLAKQAPRSRPVKPPFKVVYSNDFTNTGVTAPLAQEGRAVSAGALEGHGA